MIKEEEIKTPKILKQDPSIESKNAKKGKQEGRNTPPPKQKVSFCLVLYKFRNSQCFVPELDLKNDIV